MAHLPTSARFRARAPGPVSGRLYAATRRRNRSCCRAFPLPFGRRPSLAGHPVPPGIAPLLRSAYRATISADPDGVSMFRTRETRPGWAPSISRGQRCSRDRPEVGGRRLPLPSGQPLSPRSCHPPRGARINGTSARVHWYSPVQPSPHLWPRDGTGALGLSPEAPHPCGQDPQAHVQGGDKSRTLTRSHVPGITGPPPTDSLTTCDLTSQPRRSIVQLAATASRSPSAAVACAIGFATLDPASTHQGFAPTRKIGQE